jgi:hypothetical protein
VLVSGAFGEGNKGLHSFVRELAASGAPRLQAKLGLDPGSAAARIRRVAYERIGLAIARGHAQQLLARLGCVDVCRAYRNGAHVTLTIADEDAPLRHAMHGPRRARARPARRQTRAARRLVARAPRLGSQCRLGPDLMKFRIRRMVENHQTPR